MKEAEQTLRYMKRHPGHIISLDLTGEHEFELATVK